MITVVAVNTGPMVALVQGLHLFWLHEEHGGPDIISHVYDINGRKVVERTWAQWGWDQQEELRYQVTYHMYIASRGRLLYTSSVELVVGWAIHETLLFRYVICRIRHAHMRNDTRFSPLFCTASDKKLGGAWGQS